MVQCSDCGKVMGQLYHRADRAVARQCPPFAAMIAESTAPLKHQLRDLRLELEEKARIQRIEFMAENRELQLKMKDQRRDAKQKIMICTEKVKEMEKKTKEMENKLKTYEELHKLDKAWETIPMQSEIRGSPRIVWSAKAIAKSLAEAEPVSSESEIEIPEVFLRNR